MRRPISEAPVLAIVCCLAGCGAAAHFVPQGGMAERCANFMTKAYPDAAIVITKSEAVAESLTTITAKVEGVRKDLPAHVPQARFVAVECRFENGVLTGFRWTKGPA
jgi:hypothetical protein